MGDISDSQTYLLPSEGYGRSLLNVILNKNYVITLPWESKTLVIGDRH